MAAQIAAPFGTDPSLSLAALKPGDAGVILGVDGADAVGLRLRDLGFVPDTEIRVLRRAPLGDPMVYDLRGYRMCLRKSEAERVRVRLI